MSSGRRPVSVETLVLFLMGALFVGGGAFMCVTAYRAGEAPGRPSRRYRCRLDEPRIAARHAADRRARPGFHCLRAGPRTDVDLHGAATVETPTPAPRPKAAPVRARSAPAENPTSPSIVLGPSAPLPPSRPIELNAPRPLRRPTRWARRVAQTDADQRLRRPRSEAHRAERTTTISPPSTIYRSYRLPAQRRAARGPFRPRRAKDDPAHVDEKDRGATPPHVYDLTLREDLFHGVQALRLNPVGGGAIFGRAGLLAHTYMLGPTGDSNGCVSFKNYDAFLQAFQSGRVKRLAVVGNLN